MRKLLFALIFGLIIGTVHINNAEAQVHININIDIQPAWGPYGYEYAEYYYMPEINVYYDVINQMFYYQSYGRWVRSICLPMAYAYYDFYSLYKVVLNGMRYPWQYNRRHRQVYAKYCYNYVQIPIYCVNEPRYYRARSNYHRWVDAKYMPRNEGRPRSRDFSANTRNGRISNEMRSANVRSENATNSRSANPRSTAEQRVSTVPPRTAGLRSDREQADYNARTAGSRSSDGYVTNTDSRTSTSRGASERISSTSADNREVQRPDSRRGGSASTVRNNGMAESRSTQRSSYSVDNQSSQRSSSSVSSRSATTRDNESNVRSSNNRSSESYGSRSTETRSSSSTSRTESTRYR
jgi:hypothetical protein